jgi:hypothetical protein
MALKNNPKFYLIVCIIELALCGFAAVCFYFSQSTIAMICLWVNLVCFAVTIWSYEDISKRKAMLAKKFSRSNRCWFCRQDDRFEALLFDWEFDTFVHASCIRDALATFPNHPEARLMKYLLENPEQAKADTAWINEIVKQSKEGE